VTSTVFNRNALDDIRLGECMDDQDRRRKRGLIAFQVFIYGTLLAMFAIQLQMYLTRHW
jgi:hypothetical protein